MNRNIETATSIFTDTSQCAYFEDGRIAIIEYCIPGTAIAVNFHTLLANGYRRIGQVVYRNVCEHCSDCLPLRIETDKFKLSRSHKRTLKNNEDIGLEVLRNPFVTPDKIILYDNYVKLKHKDNKEEPGDPVNILLNIHYGYSHTIEMNYYLADKLIGVGIVDEGKDSLSSNYFYYDTDYLRRRLGVFSILQEIALARKLKKKYYYLGFYIEENPKMSYKKFFRPNQVFEKGQWMEFLQE